MLLPTCAATMLPHELCFCVFDTGILNSRTQDQLAEFILMERVRLRWLLKVGKFPTGNPSSQFYLRTQPDFHRFCWWKDSWTIFYSTSSKNKYCKHPSSSDFFLHEFVSCEGLPALLRPSSTMVTYCCVPPWQSLASLAPLWRREKRWLVIRRHFWINLRGPRVFHATFVWWLRLVNLLGCWPSTSVQRTANESRWRFRWQCLKPRAWCSRILIWIFLLLYSSSHKSGCRQTLSDEPRLQWMYHSWFLLIYFGHSLWSEKKWNWIYV